VLSEFLQNGLTMTINKSTCKPFADTFAAPGSALYAALEDGDKRKATEIYNKCARDAARLEGRASYFAADGTMMNTATGSRSIFGMMMNTATGSRSIFDDVDE
jgi:hypothetical protein